MPVVFRYVDWMIAVPLQVLALYFLDPDRVRARRPASSGAC